jgi:pyruvate kinase
MALIDYSLRAAKLIKAVEALEKGMLALEQEHAAEIARVDPAFQASARNLLHYLALRRVDVRQLQMDLAALGLSSLGRMEAYALDGVRNVLRALRMLSGSEQRGDTQEAEAAPAAFDTGRSLLQRHTALLLGEPRDGRSVRIMVTMPSAAATDPRLIRNLLDAGMDVMRINCAHDGPQAWQAMIDNLRMAERESGRRCVVYADLA